MPNYSKVIRLAGFVFLSLLFVMVMLSFLRKNVYDSRLGINLLLISRDGLGVVAVRPDSGLVSLTRLPDNLVIQTEPSGATYRVEALYKVGLPVKKPLLIAMTSVGQNLGVVLSGVVKTHSDFSLSGLREALFSLTTQGNLSLLDRYQMFVEITNLLRKRSVLTLALPSNVTDVSEEPDGEKVAKLNPAIFVWSRNQWVSDGVLSETAEVVVVNGSGREGKARQVARQIETAGGRVIDLLGAKKDVRGCVLLGDKRAHPRTVDLLVKAFFCRLERGLPLSTFVDSDVKSDLVMIVGKE